MTGYCATRLPADLAGSGWYEILSPPGPAKQFSGEAVVDWVIVGAGFAGLSAARRLTERCPEDSVVVLDAQPVAWGAAGRNSGFMIDLPHDLNSDTYSGELEQDRKQIRMNRVAIEYAAGIVEEYGLHDHYSPCGKFHGAVDQGGMHHLSDFCRHLDALGEPYTRLDRTQMQEVTGSDFYSGGIHAPGTSIIQPAGYIRGLAEGLRGKVSIYENSPVIKIDTGAQHTVHTSGGKLSAHRIILSVNGHAESFGFYRRKLMHVFTFASMTRSLQEAELKKLGGQTEWGVIPADPLGSTVRRFRDRLVIRNTFTYNPSLTTSQSQVDKMGRRHEASFRKRFPMINNVPMEYRWGGALCLSINSVAAFGEVDRGIFSAVCQNGLGTVKGTYAGIAAVDYATGQDNQIVADILDCDPPKRLYPEPFMTMGAKTSLWWKQRKSLNEL